MPDLFTPIDLLGYTLPNRIFLSAMTRTRAGDDGVPTALMRDYYVQRAPVMGNTGFDKVRGNTALGAGHADAIAFGVSFLANPDLPERLRRDAPLNKPDPATFYGEGPRGYTDYPTLNASNGASR
jgi:2,4-dienoyl-CoA reductase-like NADH-dependent reductase (Old Yellow Enzyme family)